MPKKIKQEDTDLYKKLLVGFSFGQLVLGFLYFMFAAINLPTIAVLLGISIVCMILVRAFWEDKKFTAFWCGWCPLPLSRRPDTGGGHRHHGPVLFGQ